MQDKSMGFLAVLAVLALVLLIGAMKGRAEWLLNFVFRSAAGAVLIFFLNFAAASYNMDLLVGLNPLTVLTTGILGFPGLLLLYGIRILTIL